MEVRWPKVSTVFLGEGFCGASAVASAPKPRGKQAAMVVFSSESYMSLLSVENCGSCGGGGGAHAVAVAAEPPRKSSNFGPPVNMERFVAPPTVPSVPSGDASKLLLLPERYISYVFIVIENKA